LEVLTPRTYGGLGPSCCTPYFPALSIEIPATFRVANLPRTLDDTADASHPTGAAGRPDQQRRNDDQDYQDDDIQGPPVLGDRRLDVVGP
jgi:hypothetical protein